MAKPLRSRWKFKVPQGLIESPPSSWGGKDSMVVIWPNAENFNASCNWKALHVFTVIWIFLSVTEKLQFCCLIEKFRSSKYCLAKYISKPLIICIITQSAVSDGISWNLWQNATNVYFIKRKLAINMQISAVSEVSGGSCCNCHVNSGTKTDVAKLIFIW